MGLDNNLSRRTFMRNGALITAASCLPLQSMAQGRRIAQRTFGKTGLRCGVLGLSTAHLHEAPSVEDAEVIVQHALQAGINLFDLSPNYGNGFAEKVIGRILPLNRQDTILSLKTQHCEGDQALCSLHESLKRLQTDSVDIWMLHNPALNTWNECRSTNGVLHAMQEAKHDGRCKYIGIGGMANPVWLKTYLDDFAFDVVQMPLNCADPHYFSFETELLSELDRGNIAIVGSKTFLMGKCFQTNAIDAKEALGYAMSLPVSTTLIGCANLRELHENLATANRHINWLDNDMQSLRDRARFLSTRDCEWYKQIA